MSQLNPSCSSASFSCLYANWQLAYSDRLKNNSDLREFRLKFWAIQVPWKVRIVSIWVVVACCGQTGVCLTSFLTCSLLETTNKTESSLFFYTCGLFSVGSTVAVASVAVILSCSHKKWSRLELFLRHSPPRVYVFYCCNFGHSATVPVYITFSNSSTESNWDGSVRLSVLDVTSPEVNPQRPAFTPPSQ